MEQTGKLKHQKLKSTLQPALSVQNTKILTYNHELYETSKNSPLKCCMSDILAKNKLQIKYKKIGMLRSDIWMGGTSNANSKSWTERPC